jgi:hypothetical protein
MRVHIAELVELVKQEEQRQLFKELSTGLIEISNLTEESFCCLIDSNYIIKKACKILSEYFYIFLKENLQTADIKFLCYKIINTDIEKFMKSKPILIREDIL